MPKCGYIRRCALYIIKKSQERISDKMSSVNLNRQKKINDQMKEVMDDFDRFEYFFATHWKHIVWAAVAVIVIVTAIVSVKYFSNKSIAAAALAYDKATDIAQLEKAIKDHGKAPAAVYLRLAGMYTEKKDYANARKQLLAAAADNNAVEMQWRARLNLGYVAELEGKTADAAKIFADFAKSVRTPGSAIYTAEAYVAAGRLYKLAGKTADAKAVLEAGKRFIQTVPAAERMNFQIYLGMLNNMLTQVK